MMPTPETSETLPGRECALLSILRDVIEEYREYLEDARLYQRYLQGKVATLESFADALGGVSRIEPPDLDEDYDDVPF